MAVIQTSLQARLTAIRDRIAAACAQAGRAPDSVQLVAVSKTFPVEAISAVAAAGQRHFGENYLQEAVAKMTQLAMWGTQGTGPCVPGHTDGVASPPPLRPLVWHFIGPIQSNKTRQIAEHFDWVHTVEREKIARRLSEQRPENLPPLQICIEVNVSGEATKSGVAPHDVAALARAINSLPRLQLRGLMAIPEPTGDVALQRRRFALLRELKDALVREGLALDTLSMGMSADLEAAIAEGATMVRVGTAIFGERQTR